MDQSASAQTSPDHAEPADDQFTRVSKAGWNGFTRFLLINVIVIAAALIIIGLFTVWS
jgi:hypothetical protein